MSDFFKEYNDREDSIHLSCGQCPWSVAEDYEERGGQLPPYEPVRDDYAGSHTLVERLRNEIETFDSVGGYEPDKWEVVVSNLYLLSDLAAAAAQHIRQQLDALAAEDAHFAAWRAGMAEYLATEPKEATHEYYSPL
jgi:hypothetical protein